MMLEIIFLLLQLQLLLQLKKFLLKVRLKK